MTRALAALLVAGATTAALQAQDVKTTTTVKADDGKTVVYAGCIQPGETSASFLLSSAVPVKETRTETKVDKGVAETKTTTRTSYVLIPADRMDFSGNVGRKVEVTAIEIPRGDDRTTIETKTKTEIKGKPTEEREIKEKVAQKDLPQLRVVSVRQLNERCS